MSIGGSSPLTRGKRYARRRVLTVSPAHPRSRGENLYRDPMGRRVYGSSPLTRGKHDRADRRFSRLRLIPAHAGKTPASLGSAPSPRAHPRSRGENASASLWMYGGEGSSPLTRGKHFSDAHFASRARLIPAHAGKTLRLRAPTTTRGGSSPLTRGKPLPTPCWSTSMRLIPAHAGKTRKGGQS